MTYTALAILLMCGDDFSRVNKKSIIKAISNLQKSNGSFSCLYGDSESDMRFVYCAAAICYMLNDFSGIDIDKAVKYILSSQSYDSAIGQGPGNESHGGSTYCAVAALELMGRLHELPRKDKLIKWCIERQISGFQGRINKPADTCYSFWIGATLGIFGKVDLIEFTNLKGFILSCEQFHGGFSKSEDVYADVLHTYMSLCGLSIIGEPNLKKIHYALGFSQDAVNHLKKNSNT
jgi:geranylgeranyl transferase type-1 subunit beta